MSQDEPRFKQEIQQMMYIAGETLEPASETITLIENIICEQMRLLITTASELAGRRGVRLIGNDDLFFQIRHDPARVARLRSCIKWKNARKGIKEDDDAMDEADLEELTEEAKAEKLKMPNAPLPWDVSGFFAQKPAEFDQVEQEEDEDEDFSLDRRRKYDEATRDMTVEEYVIFSEYRHASFIYRKPKRFREWTGLGLTFGYKKNEDVPEILGFLGSEMVQSLTTTALHLQQRELSWMQSAKNTSGVSSTEESHRAGLGGLFHIINHSRDPVGPRHVREAFRRMQRTPNKRRAMLNGTRQAQMTDLVLL